VQPLCGWAASGWRGGACSGAARADDSSRQSRSPGGFCCSTRIAAVQQAARAPAAGAGRRLCGALR